MVNVRSEILESYVRTMVAEAYASWCESEQEENRPTHDLSMPGPGEDWLNYAPEPTEAHYAMMAEQIARIESHLAMPVEALYAYASRECATPGARCQRRTHTPEHFGSDLAMQYVGTGASWGDDHVTRLDLPYGETLLYSREDFGLPPLPSGYSDCCCRDCFDVAIGGGLCGDCENAGCEASGKAECCREPECDDEGADHE